jgi:hypothetical protein
MVIRVNCDDWREGIVDRYFHRLRTTREQFQERFIKRLFQLTLRAINKIQSTNFYYNAFGLTSTLEVLRLCVVPEETTSAKNTLKYKKNTVRIPRPLSAHLLVVSRRRFQTTAGGTSFDE